MPDGYETSLRGLSAMFLPELGFDTCVLVAEEKSARLHGRNGKCLHSASVLDEFSERLTTCLSCDETNGVGSCLYTKGGGLTYFISCLSKTIRPFCGCKARAGSVVSLVMLLASNRKWRELRSISRNLVVESPSGSSARQEYVEFSLKPIRICSFASIKMPFLFPCRVKVLPLL